MTSGHQQPNGEEGHNPSVRGPSGIVSQIYVRKNTGATTKKNDSAFSTFVWRRTRWVGYTFVGAPIGNQKKKGNEASQRTTAGPAGTHWQHTNRGTAD